ncbi:MAG: hypothetical protein GY833_09485 [Aestuariibacter sp.]|nr:hypothetical protein [Aestuariibacter sp.]
MSSSGNLLWSSYIGGNGYDNGYDIAIDGNGATFLTGFTNSTNFDVTNGFDTTFGGGGGTTFGGGGNPDAFISKITSNGTLAWSSYLGKSGIDEGTSISVDSSGDAYVSGATSSTDFNVTNGFDTTYGGGNFDAFVTKVSSLGSILWSSYIGGSGDDEGYGNAVDTAGNVYITGRTYSSNFNVTNGFQTSFGGGGADVFVTKLSSDGTFGWSSFLGGNGHDRADDIAVDTQGNVYVTGYTQSTNLDVTNGFDTSLGGSKDAFITRISSPSAASNDDSSDTTTTVKPPRLNTDDPNNNSVADVVSFIEGNDTSPFTKEGSTLQQLISNYNEEKNIQFPSLPVESELGSKVVKTVIDDGGQAIIRSDKKILGVYLASGYLWNDFLVKHKENGFMEAEITFFNVSEIPVEIRVFDANGNLVKTEYADEKLAETTLFDDLTNNLGGFFDGEDGLKDQGVSQKTSVKLDIPPGGKAVFGYTEKTFDVSITNQITDLVMTTIGSVVNIGGNYPDLKNILSKMINEFIVTEALGLGSGASMIGAAITTPEQFVEKLISGFENRGSELVKSLADESAQYFLRNRVPKIHHSKAAKKLARINALSLVSEIVARATNFHRTYLAAKRLIGKKELLGTLKNENSVESIKKYGAILP